MLLFSGNLTQLLPSEVPKEEGEGGDDSQDTINFSFSNSPEGETIMYMYMYICIIPPAV